MQKIFFSNLFIIILSTFFSQNYSKCKVLCNDTEFIKLGNLGIPVDHGERKKNTFFISDFSKKEIQIMKENGFQIEILIEDVQKHYMNQDRMDIKRNPTCNSSNTNAFEPEVPSNFSLGSMAGFFTYEEFLNQIDLMHSIYPNLISSKAIIHNFLTHEGRPIYFLKISNNPNNDEDEPEVLYTSIHHAREPASLSNTLFYMWYLLENYNTNEEIKYLVDNTEMFFIPLLNPDGYIENQTFFPNGGGMWRKNKRNNNNGTFGVDLNRNYSYDWGTTGISFDTDSDVYPGTQAFSEPETQAIKWFCEQRDFSLAFNAHTFSNLLLFPIGSQTNVFAEDHDYFLSLASHMVQYNNYLAQKATDLYPASGDSDDYMYAEDLTIKPKIFAFTPEIGSSEDGFWPTQDRIIPLCKEMVFSNLILAHASHNYWTVKENNPVSISTSSGFFNFQVNRLGLKDTPLKLSLIPIYGFENLGTELEITALLNETKSVDFPFTLIENIQNGEEVRFVIKTDFSNFVKFDTITKQFGNPSLQQLDDASTAENWIGNWGITNQTFVSPENSFTDSPGIKYTNNTTKTYTYIPTINLQNKENAKVEFWAKWSIENNYDYVAFEVSTDDGNSWTPQCGKYTNIGTSANQSVQPNGKPIYDGLMLDWVLEEINLNDYLGQQIKVRFILKSDGGVTDEGFYFDDFKIYYNDENNNNLQEIKLNFNIYPNPAQNEILIASSTFLSHFQYEIINLEGEILQHENLKGNNNLYLIDTKNLNNGLYFIKIICENEVKMHPFSIVK